MNPKIEEPIFEKNNESEIQPEFGNFGVKMGDLEKESFVAFNANESSNQDAFAINKGRTIFAIGDGVGSEKNSGSVSRWITKKIAEEIINLDQITENWLKGKIQELEKSGFLNKYNKLSAKKNGGSSTITVVNKVDESKYDLYLLGDSPAYVVDGDGNILQEYGNETAGDPTVDGCIGIKEDNSFFIKGKVLRKEINIKDGEYIIIGSDYLSDGLDTSQKITKERLNFLQKAKEEGGLYYHGDETGAKEILPSEASDEVKKFGYRAPWALEEELQEKTAELLLYDEFSKDPVKFKEKYKNDRNINIGLMERESNRSLLDFVKINNAQDFYNNVTGLKKWKGDDATVIVIKNQETYLNKNEKNIPDEEDEPYFKILSIEDNKPNKKDEPYFKILSVEDNKPNKKDEPYFKILSVEDSNPNNEDSGNKDKEDR